MRSVEKGLKALNNDWLQIFTAIKLDNSQWMLSHTSQIWIISNQCCEKLVYI